jgi:KUP system potassium uptake protein
VTTFTVLITWRRGRELVTAKRESAEGSLREFVDQLHQRKPPVQPVPGTAVFLNRTKATAPLAMRASVEHLHALHEHVVILSIETRPLPHVPIADRLVIDDLGHSDDGITHVGAHLGYMDEPNVPDLLRLIDRTLNESTLEVDQASYFLSTIDLHRSDEPGMSRWRKRLFLATSRITADAAEYFGLPRDRTVIVGSRIEV